MLDVLIMWPSHELGNFLFKAFSTPQFPPKANIYLLNLQKNFTHHDYSPNKISVTRKTKIHPVTKIPWKPLKYAHKFASYYYYHYLVLFLLLLFAASDFSSLLIYLARRKQIVIHTAKVSCRKS